VEDLSNLTAGMYSVTVTDANGCTADTMFVLIDPTALSLSGSRENNLCSGDSTGSIDLGVSGGVGPYSYLWNTGSTSEDLSNLTAGMYSVTVTDANGCTADTMFVLIDPTALSLSGSLENNLCSGDSTGSIDLGVSGGVGPYSYLWNTGATSEDLSNLTAGMYSVTVTDANGCTADTMFVLTDPTALSLSGSRENNLCSGDSIGSIDLGVSGGVGPYSYLWNTGATSEDLSNLTAGMYSVTVTDANGCTADTMFVLTDPTALSLSGSRENNLCSGDSTGSIDLGVSGGVGPYSYLWNTGSTSEDLSNLTAGMYSVTVTDANGCTADTMFVLTDPTALSLSGSRENNLCSGDSTGSIDLGVSGGVGPYSYLWNTGATSENLSNLTAGMYSVTVTDANGCTADTMFVLIDPTALSLSGSRENNLCSGDSTGSIDLGVSGGVGPYSYLWNTGATVEDLSNLTAGMYSVTVTDANGCTADTMFVLIDPTALSLSGSRENNLCSGDSTGSIDLGVSGGVGPYSYLWNIGSTVEDLSNLTAGMYSVTVTDANGCTADTMFVLTDPTALSLSGSRENNLCSGDSTGSIDLGVSGGVGPYSYLWNTGATVEDLSNLTAGMYSVTVTDANGCTADTMFVLTDPTALSLSGSRENNLCSGDSTGSIDLGVSGGVGPYSYLWNTGATVEDLSNLTAGMYSVTVTDANGCTADTMFVLTDPTALSVECNVTPILCKGDSTGSISVAYSGGVMEYQIHVENEDASVLIDTTSMTAGQMMFENLPAGSYTVTITDANKCEQVCESSITEPETEVTVVAGSTDATSPGASDGSVNSIAQGGTPFVTMATQNAKVAATPVNGYLYEWTNSEGQIVGNTPDIDGLPAGVYTVMVTDSNGCTATVTTTISEPRFIPCPEVRMVANPKFKEESYRNAYDGAIDVTIEGGNAPYTYLWTGPNGFTATTEDIEGLTMGRYTLKVVDANGCEAYFTYYIRVERDDASGGSCEDVRITARVKQGGESYRGAQDGFVQVNLMGGQEPYQYEWMGANGFYSNDKDVQKLSAGQYTLRVVDRNGCSGYFTYFVRIDGEQMENTCGTASIYVNIADIRHATSEHSQDGHLYVTVQGGTAPYQYRWLGPNGFEAYNTTELEGLNPGVYELQVADRNGCITTFSYMVKNATCEYFAYAQFLVKDVSTIGASDGEIQIAGRKDLEAIQYDWTGPNGFTSSSRSLQDLEEGTYQLTILNMMGCRSIYEFQVGVEKEVTNWDDEFKVYPNPSNGDFMVEVPQRFSNAELQVYDANGRLAHTEKVNGKENRLNLTGLPSGIYVLRVLSNNGSLTVKLIIEN
ncbi:T9SS type A sorting domain-containing protein, partial [Algivirga pacifica]|uniref:T9SS type A sorting domain-containing protein n=1 Tax=Algivirga pacifica TaxID=1162670 RepID=UPI0031E6F5BA